MDNTRGVVFEKTECSRDARNRRKREAYALEKAKARAPKEEVPELATRVSTTQSSSWSPSGSGKGALSKRPRTSQDQEDNAKPDGDDNNGVSTTRSASEPSSSSGGGESSPAEAADRGAVGGRYSCVWGRRARPRSPAPLRGHRARSRRGRAEPSEVGRIRLRVPLNCRKQCPRTRPPAAALVLVIFVAAVTLRVCRCLQPVRSA